MFSEDNTSEDNTEPRRMNKLSRGQIQFQDITPEAWNRMFSVNLGGCFNTIQAVLPDMLSAHEGCIINVSSIWGSHGASCEVAYSCTKHAIIGLTRSLVAELAPTGASTALPRE